MFEMLTMSKKRSRGEIKLLNVPITSNKLKQKELGPKIGIVNQADSIWDDMTVDQSLEFIACIKGVIDEDIEFQIRFITGQLDLAPYSNIKGRHLSGGNKRKLCCAMSFVGSPTLEFFDEPTTGVDPVSRRRLLNIIKNIQGSSMISAAEPFRTAYGASGR